MLTQEYKEEREEKRKAKADTKLSQRLSNAHQKKIANGVKLKTKSKKKKEKIQKEDYRITYCNFVKVDDPNDLVSAISGKPSQDLHHIWGRRGDLYSEPYNMIPLTREEHTRVHAHNSYNNKEAMQIIAKKYIEFLLSNKKPVVHVLCSQMTSSI
jgi:hypothetical protein